METQDYRTQYNDVLWMLTSSGLRPEERKKLLLKKKALESHINKLELIDQRLQDDPEATAFGNAKLKTVKENMLKQVF